ncbi:MAG: cysteine desulfurase [Clostridiales bacterium]|jgi:cysteine desulfurase/selenocysteine lyase|nr:cysteine desulfurase [Clostridiales bacterium]
MTINNPCSQKFDMSNRANLFDMSDESRRLGIADHLCRAHLPDRLAFTRDDFPIFNEKVNNRSLVWLDNAATTQKPKTVIDRLVRYYERENSNVHRGAHALAVRATDALEQSRQTAASFINARADEVFFVRGATEGINLIAQSFVRDLLRPCDEILLTELEHHANIVPWQMITAATDAIIRVAPVDDSGQIIISEFKKLLCPRTKFVSICHISNALGTVAPIEEMIRAAHDWGAPVLVDAAQSVAHMPVNVKSLDADFLVFSGHKIYAPTGIGVVYGKAEYLERAKPYHGGGNMIADVTFEKTIYNKPPQKFEAGTLNIAGAVGLASALDYVSAIGMANIHAVEQELMDYAARKLSLVPRLSIIGCCEKSGALSFVLKGMDNEAVARRLDEAGIAVRAGHHCAQPILRRFGLEGTVRASFGLYNTSRDVDALEKNLCDTR